MGKTNKTGRTKGAKRDFVMLERYLLRSTAWRSLGPVARAAYLEFGHRYNGSNNGAIALSIRDLAGALGVGKDTANKAVNNLLDRGFIAIMKRGYFSLKARHCSEYRLTVEKCDVTNSLPSKDFTRWVANVQNTVRLQGPNGTATGTEGENTTRIYPFRSLKTDRERNLGSPHGTATGTPLYSTIGDGERESVASGDHDASRHARPDNQIEPMRATARALEDISVVECLKPFRDFLDLSKLAPNPNWPPLTQKRPVESFSVLGLSGIQKLEIAAGDSPKSPCGIPN